MLLRQREIKKKLNKIRKIYYQTVSIEALIDDGSKKINKKPSKNLPKQEMWLLTLEIGEVFPLSVCLRVKFIKLLSLHGILEGIEFRRLHYFFFFLLHMRGKAYQVFALTPEQTSTLVIFNYISPLDTLLFRDKLKIIFHLPTTSVTVVFHISQFFLSTWDA